VNFATFLCCGSNYFRIPIPLGKKRGGATFFLTPMRAMYAHGMAIQGA